jgi:hypothetical protein
MRPMREVSTATITMQLILSPCCPISCRNRIARNQPTVPMNQILPTRPRRPQNPPSATHPTVEAAEATLKTAARLSKENGKTALASIARSTSAAINTRATQPENAFGMRRTSSKLLIFE